MRFSKILIFLFFSFKLCNAQSDTTQGRTAKVLLLISAGATIPLGEFSKLGESEGSSNSFDIGDNKAGSAKIGFNGRLNIHYLFSKNFGLNFTFFGTNNKAAIIDSTDLFPPPYGQAHGHGREMLSYAYHTSTWLTYGFLLGFSAAFYSGNTILILRINPGYQRVESPETKLHTEGYLWSLNWSTTYPYS